MTTNGEVVTNAEARVVELVRHVTAVDINNEHMCILDYKAIENIYYISSIFEY